MSLVAALTGIAGLRVSSFYAVTGNAKRHTQSGVPFRLERVLRSPTRPVP